jgi:transcriptional regulator with XRE-family HTH domain
MEIGQRLRKFREAKKFSQGDIERRTGLLRCYTSRVENGYTVPSMETLEKFAGAMEIPLYRLFYEGTEPPRKPKLSSAERLEPLWGTSKKEWRELRRLTKSLSKMDGRKRTLLFGLAKRMADHNQPMRRLK